MQKSENSKVRRKLYMIWYHIKERCYNEDHERYNLYGGKGVKLCDEWLDLNSFYEDVIKVDGYDREKLLNGLIHLDKDSKISGNKIYNINNCSFISKEMNNKFKPNQMNMFVAVSPQGKRFNYLNQSECARENNLKQTNISACLKNKQKTHRGWTFEYIDG
jgi:hypothetical protein